MRILVISNLYPPGHIGGYELGCRDIVDALQARGHELRVLTGTCGTTGLRSDDVVKRQLVHDAIAAPMPWRVGRYSRLLRKEYVNQRAFRRLTTEFRPEVVYIWNPTGISTSIIAIAQDTGIPTAFYVSDHWLEHWSPEHDDWFSIWRPSHAGARRQIKSLAVGLLDLANLSTELLGVDYRGVQFASRYLKQRALAAHRSVEAGKVIHWGVDLDRFRGGVPRDVPPDRLLYVGQVAPHKGVHTAIAAVALLYRAYGHHHIKLDIVGGCLDSAYYHRLRDIVAREGLGDVVRFLGLLPREQLPEVYRSNDIFIFPSEWPEPFSIALLEAMASGLAVVSTLTGGTSEVLSPGENALEFPIAQPDECAAALNRLLCESGLLPHLSRRAMESTRSFSIEKMVCQIEEALSECIAH